MLGEPDVLRAVEIPSARLCPAMRHLCQCTIVMARWAFGHALRPRVSRALARARDVSCVQGRTHSSRRFERRTYQCDLVHRVSHLGA